MTEEADTLTKVIMDNCVNILVNTRINEIRADYEEELQLLRNRISTLEFQLASKCTCKPEVQCVSCKSLSVEGDVHAANEQC